MRWKTTEYAGWGRVLRTTGDLARPERLPALKASFREAPSPAVGNRRSYGDTALNSGGRVIDMTRLDRLLSFDPESGVLEAEAGICIGEIARIFAPRGWSVPVLPGTGFATLGGCIGNDVHGKSHHIAGSFGQHVLSITLMGANGRMRTITKDSDADLFAATIGGLGQTGIIVSAKLRLVEGGSAVLDVRESRADSLDEFMSMLEHSTATYSVGWIDAAAKGAHLGRGILEEGEYRIDATPPKSGKPRAIPRDAPKFLLSPPVVRLFNSAYFRRVPVEGRRRDRTLEDFFFPLDRIHNWNRLYGKPGFYQFQCVVPPVTAHDSIRRMMAEISQSGLASPLAVLKRLGAGRGGLISFPMEGFTLAIDFANRPGAEALLRALEDITLEAGGRIYFGKDALMRPDTARAMYPDLPAFARIANAADPKRVLETDLVRRLKLRDVT